MIPIMLPDKTTVTSKVDKTVTVATRTIVGVTKGTTTILQLDAVHNYDAGRSVIRGATVNTGTNFASLNGTFNIDRIVSSTEIEVAANTSGEAGTYDANSGQTQRVTETGQENENVVKDIDFNNVTGSGP